MHMDRNMIYIADVGQNYKNLDSLEELAFMVKNAGADFLKPQLFLTESLYTKDHPYYDWIRSHELSLQDAEDIFSYCESIDLKCIFSPFDIARIRYCQEIGVERIKVANRMCTDLEFLHAVKETGIPPIISVSKEKHLPYFTYDDIFGKDKYQLLYVSSKYPSQITDYSLSAIARCNGLSDHTDNLCLSIASSTICDTIERHVWYRNYNSPDMICSIHTSQFKNMVDVCNQIASIR